jgi:hypothetical protein
MKKMKLLLPCGRLLLVFLFTCLSIPILADIQLWVGEEYTCDMTTYANTYGSYSIVNTDWDTDSYLYVVYGGSYVHTVRPKEYTDKTLSVSASWMEVNFSNPDPSGDRHRSHTWYITVKDNPLILTNTSVKLKSGESEYISYGFTYSNSYTSMAELTYSSSNTGVATVNRSGQISAISKGTAVITVKSSISKDSKKVYVTVEDDDQVMVTSITLNYNSLELMEGDTKTLWETVLPSDATNKSVTWTSNKTSVATVNDYGLVTAVSEGTATITCKAMDGSNTKATCVVTVLERQDPPIISFVSMECSTPNLNELTCKDKLRFRATFKNSGAPYFVTSEIILSKYQSNKVFARSEADISYYGANKNVTIDYEYALDTIPPGRYQATVMYYDAWERNSWIYNSRYLYNITIIEDNQQKGDGTLAHPFNAQEAIEQAWNLSVGETTTESYFVKGIISKIKYTYNAQYGTATFWISEDGTTNNQFYAYGSYYLNNKPWVDGDNQIAIGDEVILYGKMANYNGTLEMANRENYIYSHNGKASVSAISDIVCPQYPQAIYSPSGQRLTELRKGINIVNGKKVMRK